MYRDESTQTNILLMCFSVRIFVLFITFLLISPVSTDELSHHPNKAKRIAIERDVEEESVIFKHGEECVSGTDSVRVAQKWRKFKSHAEILREEGAYVTVAFQYSCPKC